MSDESSSAGLPRQQLKELLDEVAGQGHSQARVAAQVGVPPQYLSDVLHGRRSLSELFARRLGEELDVNHLWLLGMSTVKERVRRETVADAAKGSHWLAVFSGPIRGEPRGHADWDGTAVEVTGAAAAKLGLALQPYVLRFRNRDVRGRLHYGDLILISQSSNKNAEISVVLHRKRCFLARPNDDGSWWRVTNGDRLPSTAPEAGHCVGVLWSPLA